MADESIARYLCSKCKTSKPVSDFYEDRTTPQRHKTACKTCYQAAPRRKTFRPKTCRPVDSKTCFACGVVKPASEYNKKASITDGLNTYCKPCAKQVQAHSFSKPHVRARAKQYMASYNQRPEVLARRREKYSLRMQDPDEAAKQKAQQRQRWKASYKKNWKYRLRKAYGITEEWYWQQLSEQGGACAICDSPPKKRALSIDHSHETGRVRGLLCSPCNVAIGMLKESPQTCWNALYYLLEHSLANKS